MVMVFWHFNKRIPTLLHTVFNCWGYFWDKSLNAIKTAQES